MTLAAGELMRRLRSTSPSEQAAAAHGIALMMGVSPTAGADMEHCVITAGAIPARGIPGALVSAGAIPSLVHLLRTSSVAKVQELAALALMFLGSLDEYVIMIAEAGGVPALVRLVQRGPAPVQATAVATLAYVMAYAGGHTQAIRSASAEAIPSAVQMLRCDTEVMFREAAMHFLAVIVALDGHSRARVAATADAIHLIVQMLGSSSLTLHPGTVSEGDYEPFPLDTLPPRRSRPRFGCRGRPPAGPDSAATRL